MDQSLLRTMESIIWQRVCWKVCKKWLVSTSRWENILSLASGKGVFSSSFPDCIDAMWVVILSHFHNTTYAATVQWAPTCMTSIVAFLVDGNGWHLAVDLMTKRTAAVDPDKENEPWKRQHLIVHLLSSIYISILITRIWIFLSLL